MPRLAADAGPRIESISGKCYRAGSAPRLTPGPARKADHSGQDQRLV